MGKKRSHQVTRSILKSFPAVAEKVLDEKDISDHSDIEQSNDEDVSGSEVSEEDDGFDEDELCAVDSEGEGDDFTEDELSEVDNDEESEDDADSIEDLKKSKKKAKKTIEVPDLGLAIANILGEKTKGDQPILARRKGIERKIEDAKLEAKARTVLRKQRLATKDAAHQSVPDMSRANYEKLLKKAATKGVVQLFNAIHQHQVMKEKLAKEKAEAGGAKKAEVAAQIKQISKTSFLDMLKGGSTAQLKKQ